MEIVSELNSLFEFEANQNTDKRLTGDVASFEKANKNASNLKTASSRINTTTEFPEAFKIWFQSLGYKPDNPAISISKVLIEVKKVLLNLGYK